MVVVGWGVQFYEFISMYFSLGITEFLFLSTHQNPAGAGLTRYEFAGPIFCLRHEVPVWEAPVWVLALVMVMVIEVDVDERDPGNDHGIRDARGGVG